MHVLDFKAKQREFSAYIKDPLQNPAPADVAKPRMDMYRELFFNNINSFLSSNFPVLYKVLTPAQWQELAQDFFCRHHSQTSYFSEIAEEFLLFLQRERSNANDYPFLFELAHYEWVEMALAISTDELPPMVEYIENPLQQKITLSPLAWPLAYRYPVHQISPEFLPALAPTEPTYLVVYRDWEDEVHFIQLTALTFRLLQIIAEAENPIVDVCLQQIAAETSHPNPPALIEYGLQILDELGHKSVVIIG